MRILDRRLSTSHLFLVTLLKGWSKFSNHLHTRSLIVTNLQDDHFSNRYFIRTTALDLEYPTWGQQLNEISRIQESLDNLSSQMSEEVDRLESIGKDFAELKQGQIVTTYLFVIAYLMGLAFVIFGLFIGRNRDYLSLQRLYLVAFFALVIPVTVILLRYITITIYGRDSNNPVLTVAFILLIPVLTLYGLMIVKYRYETPRNK